jgi:hypothetical protein
MLLVVVPALCVVFLSKRDRADMAESGGDDPQTRSGE